MWIDQKQRKTDECWTTLPNDKLKKLSFKVYHKNCKL